MWTKSDPLLLSPFTGISSTTLSLRKSIIIIALQAAFLYVRYALLFVTPGLYLVHLVCTFRAQVTIVCVKGNYCYTIKHHFSKNKARIGFIIFRRNALSPCAAPSLQDSWRAPYHFTGLAWCIMLRFLTFPPAEKEVVFTAYSMQPTQGNSWRQRYHNGLDRNLQIDAVLAFSAQCPWHRNVIPTSVAITTARCAQAVPSCSEHFAKHKCYYGLTLTTFVLRFGLGQLLFVLLCLYTCTNVVTLYVFLSLSYSYLYILHSCVYTVMLCYVILC